MNAACPAHVEAQPESGSNFYLGFLLLPKSRREALAAVYAYCRLIDDIVDSGAIPKDEARRMLDFWRSEVDRLYAGSPTQPLSARLAGPVAEFGLPKAAFLEMIRGCEMDLAQRRYETFEELGSYMDGVAGSVGALSLAIFGPRHTPPERLAEFAKLFGHAFQLTNIIRDVGADLEMGRVYLPLADLRDAGYPLEALARRESGPAFQALMETQYLRARGLYRMARGVLDPRDRSAVAPAEIMAHIYEAILEKTRDNGFDVLSGRTRLGALRKLALAGKAWLYCHGF